MKTQILLFVIGIIGAGLTSCGTPRGCKNSAYAHVAGDGYVIQNISNTEINQPPPLMAHGGGYGSSMVSRETVRYARGGPTGCMQIMGPAIPRQMPPSGCIVGYNNGKLCVLKPCHPPQSRSRGSVRGPIIGNSGYIGNGNHVPPPPGYGYGNRGYGGNGYGQQSRPAPHFSDDPYAQHTYSQLWKAQQPGMPWIPPQYGRPHGR